MSHITAVGQIHISVSDFQRALAFYRDTLGLTLLFEVPEQSMAFFKVGDIRLYLGVPSSPEYAANSFLYYKTDDIQESYQHLSEKGVGFLHPPQKVHADQRHELWMAGFQDSEGNYAQLMQEKPL